MVGGRFRQPLVFNPAPEIKKKKLPRVLIIVLILMVLVAGLVYFLFFSKYFQIKVIAGDQRLTSDEEIVQIIKDKNIFLIKRSTIEFLVASKFPEVSNIKIIRGIPDTIKVEVSERTPKLIWKTSDKMYLVDSRGYIYGEAKGQEDLPVVEDAHNLKVPASQQVVTENFIDFLQTINQNFTNVAVVPVLNYKVEETIFQMDVVTTQGWYAKFDITWSAGKQLEALAQFLKDNPNDFKEYIDLRIEGKVYFK